MAKEFLGHGLAFPVEVDGQGRLPCATAEAKVQQSLLVVLATARGERVMRPQFGSRLHELVFEPLSASTKGRVAHYAAEAITAWEPRVDLLGVDVKEDPATRGKLLVDVDYRVRATNSRFNLVYPFYLQEGNDGGTRT
ncbi:MAG: GPW/gp25 family protein [bacterium]|nr:GPW/gp25 family protein [bacterium]